MQNLLVLSVFLALLSSPFSVNDDKDNGIDVSQIDSVRRNIYLDEISVVATVKENTQMRRLPSAVSIVSAQQMEAAHVTSLKGVSDLVPNLFVPDYGSRLTSAIYIRGIGSRINTPAVGMYVDNVPYVDKSAFDFNFYDVERVDVLRGPQGTLYGRNAMGGIVRVYTKNPFSHEGTDVKMGYATGDNHRTASLTHYHRVSSSFAFSGGGYYEGSDGFFRNTYLDKNADRMQAGGGRLRGIFKPGDMLNLDFSVSYDYSDEGAYPYYYTGTLDGSSYEDGSIGSISNNREGLYRRGLFNAGVNLEYKAPHFIMNSVTGYQNLNDRMFMDQDFLAPDIYSLEQKQRINTFSEELTFKNSDSQSRWNWICGISGLWQTLHTDAPVNFYDDGLRWLEGNVNSIMPEMSKLAMLKMMGFTDMGVNFRGDRLSMNGSYETPTLNFALFHQSTLRLTDRMSVVAGVRLDYEHLKADYYSPADVLYGFRMPNAYNPKMAVDLQDLSSHILYEGTLKDQQLSLLPKFAVKYELAQSGNLYASAAMGRRSGGYNLQMFGDLLQGKLRVDMMDGVKNGVGDYLDYLVQVTPNMPSAIMDPDKKVMVPLPEYVRGVMGDKMPKFEVPAAEQIVYKPEYSWNFEAGTHLNFLERRVQLDAAMFLINTYDQQIARFASSGLGRMMVNAGKSRSCGAELTVLYRPDSHWVLTGNYGYTHAEFTDYDAGDGNDYTGNFVPFVPAHNIHLDASYMWHLSDDGWLKGITLGASYRGAGRIYWTEANNAYQNFYSVLDARVVFDTKLASIHFWGRNLTDTGYNTFFFESAGRGYEQHAKPVQFGVDVKFEFQ